MLRGLNRGTTVEVLDLHIGRWSTWKVSGNHASKVCKSAIDSYACNLGIWCKNINLQNSNYRIKIPTEGPFIAKTSHSQINPDYQDKNLGLKRLSPFHQGDLKLEHAYMYYGVGFTNQICDKRIMIVPLNVMLEIRQNFKKKKKKENYFICPIL